MKNAGNIITGERLLTANELRLGNIVDFEYGEENEKTFGYIKPIEEIEELICIGDESFKCKGVLLTEEWLLRFGFKNLSGDWNCASIIIKHPIEGAFTEFMIDDLCTASLYNDLEQNFIIRKDIQYVHELQSLYFGLTGEELTLIENDLK